MGIWKYIMILLLAWRKNPSHFARNGVKRIFFYKVKQRCRKNWVARFFSKQTEMDKISLKEATFGCKECGLSSFFMEETIFLRCTKVGSTKFWLDDIDIDVNDDVGNTFVVFPILALPTTSLLRPVSNQSWYYRETATPSRWFARKILIVYVLNCYWMHLRTMRLSSAIGLS